MLTTIAGRRQMVALPPAAPADARPEKSGPVVVGRRAMVHFRQLGQGVLEKTAKTALFDSGTAFSLFAMLLR
jgi:hypothetical protein